MLYVKKASVSTELQLDRLSTLNILTSNSSLNAISESHLNSSLSSSVVEEGFS